MTFRDSYGWPVERIRGRPITNLIRLLIHTNLRQTIGQWLVADAVGVTMKLHEDAMRFRWLTEDHDDRETRLRRNDLLKRMSVTSYSAACMDIDIARGVPMTETTPGKGR